jgi:hypothetical protein
MAINFPSSPAAGDTYTYSGRSYRYSSQGAWDRIGTAAVGSDTDAGVFESATQAEMETATAVDKAVTPGRMQYHPGVSKAWVLFVGTGTPAITVSHNVTSLTDNGTGDHTVNFTTAFSTANFAALPNLRWVNTAFAAASRIGPIDHARTTSSYQGRSGFIDSGGALNEEDQPALHLAFFGDQ